MDQYNLISQISTDHKYIRQIINDIFGQLTDEQFNKLFSYFEWIRIKAGNQLIKQGAPSDHIYFVVYGRLTAIYENNFGKSNILGDIIPGQAVGETGVIADQPRTAHVFAARDSVLIRLSKEMLYKLGNQFPVLILNVAKTIIRRTDQNTKGRKVPHPKNVVFLLNERSTLKSQFFEYLKPKLAPFGKITFLDQETILNELGVSLSEFTTAKGEDSFNIELQKKLDAIENSSDYVIYIANEDEKVWKNRAIAQADIFYILKEFGESEKLTTTEQKLFSNHLKYKLTKKNLVLLHENGDNLPQNTSRFLHNRSLEMHHHVRMDRISDIERISRFISGNAIGIALSGGGAKGLAHVGIVLSLREKGIPIDFFSGTSIGTFITALGALDLPSDDLVKKGSELANKAPTRRKNLNIAPLISLMKGKHLDDLLEKYFGTFNIEDTWINSCYVASDLTERKKVIITSGPINNAIRASVALPGIFPPAVNDNSLYVDGGLLENLPIESLGGFPVGKTIAVTLHSTKKYNLEYDVVPESWDYIKDKFLGKKKFKVPSISTIIMESMVLASYSKYEETTKKADLHLHPPINKIGILEWKSYDKMVRIGKEYTDQIVTNEIKNKLMPYIEPA